MHDNNPPLETKYNYYPNSNGTFKLVLPDNESLTVGTISFEGELFINIELGTEKYLLQKAELE